MLHECGVPPIHTPPSTIKNLPPEIQKNVYAVHIAENKAKAEGLRRALPGFGNTLTLEISDPNVNGTAIKFLSLLCLTDIFRDANIDQCVKLLEMSTRRYYPKDTTIEGNVGGVFFIIMDGVVSVEREGKDPRHLTLGDSFGEISAMTVESETMKMTAVTDVFIAVRVQLLRISSVPQLRS